MHETDEYIVGGTYEELGWLIGCSPEVVARCVVELNRTKTADVTLGNGNVTLMSRRLKREVNDREQTRLRVQRSRCNADVTEMKRDRVISKKKEVKNKEEKEAVAEAAPVSQLFDFWKATMSLNGKTLLTPKRKRLISDRLREGYTIERIQNAIRGCAASAFHSGQNDTHTTYNDIELICRSGEKVEFFEQKWLGQPQAKPLTPEQENDREAREAVQKGKDLFYSMYEPRGNS